ncbi:cytochrome P450 [Sporichthya polymorpha]|uniref:cytochrome P450 n=1 Tax=Sporichthya polymorpha TaxID=35751 RepID=UPI000360C2AA|nr:cytochrome P450 [Sporichthya polymorpha]
MTESSTAAARGCPVVHDETKPEPAPFPGLFARFDGYRDHNSSVLWSTDAQGYWIFTDHTTILEGLRQTDLWSSKVITVTDPEPRMLWIPVMLDAPEHVRWRNLLAAWFTPRRVKSMADEHRRLAVDVVAGIADRGRCDVVSDFARVYPSTIFLSLMGMPQSMLGQFYEWEHDLLHLTPAEDPGNERRNAAGGRIQKYFRELLAERRAEADAEAADIVRAALSWEFDGRPVDDADLLNCLLLLFMAGLDTVANELAFALHHLATHPADRERCVANPELWPVLVEEVLRVYPSVQTARKATRDAEFAGVQVRKGDMALFPLAAAGRDPKVFADSLRVDLDRPASEGRHLTFGSGPHHCLGAHLARQEMVLALQEWHRRIPTYRLHETPLLEGAQVWGLTGLELQW